MAVKPGICSRTCCPRSTRICWCISSHSSPSASVSPTSSKGWMVSFEKYFEADEDVMRYVRPVSRFGLIARGVVFMEIALFLVVSGSTYKAMDPPGMKDALDALQNLPAGAVILMVMGLIAFSVYSFVEAAWRKINTDVPGVPRVWPYEARLCIAQILTRCPANDGNFTGTEPINQRRASPTRASIQRSWRRQGQTDRPCAQHRNPVDQRPYRRAAPRSAAGLCGDGQTRWPSPGACANWPG